MVKRDFPEISIAQTTPTGEAGDGGSKFFGRSVSGGDIDALSSLTGVSATVFASLVEGTLVGKLSSLTWLAAMAKDDQMTLAGAEEGSIFTPLYQKNTHSNVVKTLQPDSNIGCRNAAVGNEVEKFRPISFSEIMWGGNTQQGDLAHKMNATYSNERATFDSGYNRLVQREWTSFATALALRSEQTLPYVSFIRELLARWSFEKLRFRGVINKKALSGGTVRKGADFLPPTISGDSWDRTYLEQVRIFSRDCLDSAPQDLPTQLAYVSGAADESSFVRDLLCACMSRHSLYPIFPDAPLTVVFPDMGRADIHRVLRKYGMAPSLGVWNTGLYYMAALHTCIPDPQVPLGEVCGLQTDILRLRDVLMWEKVVYQRDSGELAFLCDVETGCTGVMVGEAQTWAKIAYVMRIVRLVGPNGEISLPIRALESRLPGRGAVVGLVHDRCLQYTIGHWHNLLERADLHVYYHHAVGALVATGGMCKIGGYEYHSLVTPEFPQTIPSAYVPYGSGTRLGKRYRVVLGGSLRKELAVAYTRKAYGETAPLWGNVLRKDGGPAFAKALKTSLTAGVVPNTAEISSMLEEFLTQGAVLGDTAESVSAVLPNTAEFSYAYWHTKGAVDLLEVDDEDVPAFLMTTRAMWAASVPSSLGLFEQDSITEVAIQSTGGLLGRVLQLKDIPVNAESWVMTSSTSAVGDAGLYVQTLSQLCISRSEKIMRTNGVGKWAYSLPIPALLRAGPGVLRAQGLWWQATDYFVLPSIALLPEHASIF